MTAGLGLVSLQCTVKARVCDSFGLFLFGLKVALNLHVEQLLWVSSQLEPGRIILDFGNRMGRKSQRSITRVYNYYCCYYYYLYLELLYECETKNIFNLSSDVFHPPHLPLSPKVL